MIAAITELNSQSDRSYLDMLYRTHFGTLKKLAFSILRNEEAAEETVTDAMLSLFSLVPKLRVMKDWEVAAYLRTTVRRAAYKTYQVRKKQNATEFLLEDSLLFSLSPTGTNLEETLIQNEDFQIVRDAIAALPERDRRLLYLKYAAGFRAEEIGQLTGETAAAVRMCLTRARRRVLKQLEERGWADD